MHVSVIGCGNMGGAMIAGLSKAGGYTITACDVDPDALDQVADHADETTTDSADVQDSDVVVLAVKPDLVQPVLGDLDLDDDQTLLSVAAGVPTDRIEELTAASVARVMPNLAAEYGEMAAAVTGDVTDDIRGLLGDLGSFVEIDEKLMHAATAVNGSGPAFVFYCIKAMAEAGSECGLPDEASRTLAAQTFKGAAEIVLNADDSLEELIDAVCSPKGTTIEGMEELWDSSLDADMAKAVEAAEHRSRELSEEH